MLDTNLVEQISQHVEQIKHELKQSSSEIAKLNQEILHKDTKIHALNVELTYYHRLRYQSKAERFNPDQRDLFNETLDENIASIEAEHITQNEIVTMVQRKNLPDDITSRIPCHASTTTTNLSRVSAVNAVMTS